MTHLFASGQKINGIWKFDADTMQKVDEFVMGRDVGYDLLFQGETLYRLGGAYDYVDIHGAEKYDPTTLERLAFYNDPDRDFLHPAYGDGYLFAKAMWLGDSVIYRRIEKIDPQTMQLADSGPTFTSTDDIYHFHYHDGFLYAGMKANKLRRLDPATFQMVDESPYISGGVQGMVIIGQRIYVVGLNGYLRVYRLSDLSYVERSAWSNGGWFRDIITDGAYLYLAGGYNGDQKVYKVHPESLELLASSEAFPNGLKDIETDGDFIYGAGNGPYVVKLDREDLSTLYNVPCGDPAVENTQVWSIAVDTFSPKTLPKPKPMVGFIEGVMS